MYLFNVIPEQKQSKHINFSKAFSRKARRSFHSDWYKEFFGRTVT